MAILMTGLCEKGVGFLWKQCDEELFPKGLEYLESAMHAGDPEALFFLGFCYSWADGNVGFNDKKARECYKEGARAGSYRCVIGALRAGQYDDDFKAAARYTLAESYEELRKAAGQGEPFAAYQIATALEWEDPGAVSGDAGETDSCLFWYEQAASGGIVPAMVKAGRCYMEGCFTGPDREKAIHYAEQAASQGNAWGLYQMGVYFQESQEEEAAFAYFKAASVQGDKGAPYYLGKMYLTGTGTERDVKKAVESFELAADRENTECLAELGDIFYRDEVVERNNERAFFWYSRAYAVGDKRAALPLGHLYLSTWEKQDYQKAEKYLTEAAQLEENGSVHLTLGNIYRNGLGCEPELLKAMQLYEKGAEKGNAECMEVLGELYFLGEETERDYGKAFYWLDKAREADMLQSYAKLGFLYLKGYGCEVDEDRARELFEVAAESECDGEANYELGYIYERRNTSAEDLDLAAEYYQRAIELGNDSAMRRFTHFKKNLFGKWKVSY